MELNLPLAYVVTSVVRVRDGVSESHLKYLASLIQSIDKRSIPERSKKFFKEADLYEANDKNG